MMTFNDFIQKHNLKTKATSNKKTQHVFNSIGLNNVGIFLRDGLFKSDNRLPGVRRPQMNLKQLKRKQNQIGKTKNFLKAGSMHENVEINDQYSDEILDNKDI